MRDVRGLCCTHDGVCDAGAVEGFCWLGIVKRRGVTTGGLGAEDGAGGVGATTGGAAGGSGNFAIHIGKLNSAGTAFVANVTNPDGSITSGTGFARDGSSVRVPDPASILLLGSGLLIVGGYTRKARRRN